jgi:hypothetical protein
MEPAAIGRGKRVEQPPVSGGELQQFYGAADSLDERQISGGGGGRAFLRQHRQTA